ncbi:MAG: BrnA antitoxin family protein [Paracoccaceae bacterium]
MERRTDKGTKTERLARTRFFALLRRFEDEEPLDYAISEQIPEAWRTLEDDVAVHEPKVKITLMLDTSVARFYRAMGHGYQARINRVLATYAQLKIADVRHFFDPVRTQDFEEAGWMAKVERKGR